MNFIYCLDDNYNVQCNISVYSLLENTDIKINIYIIHKTKDSPVFFNKKIMNHKNLDSIKVYKFENEVKDFPNLIDSHVSEATYYRLFIEDYLPKDIDELIYLDADVVLINPIGNRFADIFKDIKSSDYIVCAKTEIPRNEYSIELFDNLEMTTDKYFNAGVLFINYSEWLNQSVQSELIDKFYKYHGTLRFWDQDILNSYFDGNYLELPEELNKVANLYYGCDSENIETIQNFNDNFLIHYAGKHKPWTIVGILSYMSNVYHDLYFEIFQKRYHLIVKNRLNSLKVFKQSLKDKSFFNVKNKLTFLYYFIIQIFKPKRNK